MNSNDKFLADQPVKICDGVNTNFSWIFQRLGIKLFVRAQTRCFCRVVRDMGLQYLLQKGNGGEHEYPEKGCQRKTQPKHLASGYRVNHWEKWMLIYVMDFDFSVTPNSVIWKYPVKWVYLILFKVHYRSLNLCMYLWKTGLDWLRRCLLMKRNVNLLITTASHILSIPSDSPWGFFWGTWVQRSKKVGFFFFFFWHVSTQLSNL